jgi:hypothetical protein
MQITINIPDNFPQTLILQQVKEFEKKLTQQAVRDVAGSLSSYANDYISTQQAIQQAWQEVMDEKYHRT